MSECEFERTTDDGALWFCRLPDGHPGDHACTNACDYPETHPYGAKALFEESQGLDQDNSWDDPLPDEWRAAWHEAAEAVITAALTAAFKEGEA